LVFGEFFRLNWSEFQEPCERPHSFNDKLRPLFQRTRWLFQQLSAWRRPYPRWRMREPWAFDE
jgi:hypothetical protein